MNRPNEPECPHYTKGQSYDVVGMRGRTKWTDKVDGQSGFRLKMVGDLSTLQLRLKLLLLVSIFITGRTQIAGLI